jgi:hypothetical protein
MGRMPLLARAAPLVLGLCIASARAGADGGPPPVDPAAVNLDVNAARFPATSFIDFSYLVDPPAGRRGHLTVSDEGRLAFQDGAAVRFWGINVAKDSVFQPRATVDAAVDAIARAGFNLVRLHHIDDATGLLPPERPDAGSRIAADKLNCVDYWIARLKARGIYVYLDLLAYRTFRDWEGVPDGERLGRGAKPYAVFDERLIELQQQYAVELLVEHVNPYTGLSYADDPAVCLIELCDENGLVHRQTALAELAEPYASDLRGRWNAWLRDRYGGSVALQAAWAGALRMDESLERGTVALRGARNVASRRAPGASRRADLLRFAHDTHRLYFARMRDFLRGHGVRVPITAVGRPGALPDIRAAAAELDFVATNFYWDHPFYPADRQWQLPALYRNENEVQSHGVHAFIPATAIANVSGKPLIVREWNACWPNKYRSTAMLAAAAYANLQRYDGMILFAYGTQDAAGKLSFFDVRRDPARWGLVGLAARCFYDGDIRPARQSVGVVWSDSDTFAPGVLPRRRADSWRVDDIYDLGWVCRVSSVLEGLPGAPKADALVDPSDASPDVQDGLPSLPPTPSETGGRLLSATGELVRDERSGVFKVNTPTLQVVGGCLDALRPATDSALTLKSQSSIGTLCAASLDGRPLPDSEHYVVKMVSFAVNTGEGKALHGRSNGRDVYALTDAGRAPVLTLGRATDRPTSVLVSGRPVFDIWTANGTWELVREREQFLLYCDTAGVRFFIHDLPSSVTVTRYGADGALETHAGRQPALYPPSTRCLRLMGKPGR